MTEIFQGSLQSCGQKPRYSGLVALASECEQLVCLVKDLNLRVGNFGMCSSNSLQKARCSGSIGGIPRYSARQDG